MLNVPHAVGKGFGYKTLVQVGGLHEGKERSW